jgi:hypothetical protein
LPIYGIENAIESMVVNQQKYQNDEWTMQPWQEHAEHLIDHILWLLLMGLENSESKEHVMNIAARALMLSHIATVDTMENCNELD